MAKNEWVRVESEDELRAGMTMELASCCRCGRRHRFMLMSQSATVCPTHGGHSCPRWGIAGSHDGPPRFCPLIAISEGRLFRLADFDTTDDAEVRSKELEGNFS